MVEKRFRWEAKLPKIQNFKSLELGWSMQGHGRSLLPIHIPCTILNICTEPIVRGDAYVIETESFLTVMSSAARAHGPTRLLLP